MKAIIGLLLLAGTTVQAQNNIDLLNKKFLTSPDYSGLTLVTGQKMVNAWDGNYQPKTWLGEGLHAGVICNCVILGMENMDENTSFPEGVHFVNRYYDAYGNVVGEESMGQKRSFEILDDGLYMDRNSWSWMPAYSEERGGR